MTSDWKRAPGIARTFVGNSMGGLRGGSNLASWFVVGTIAYFLWIKPSQDRKKEEEQKAALVAAYSYRYGEK
ncbi:hypothetical protein MANES_05G128900v8 [Manihot esculenta]|uniref:Uncharacterized protein n=1 Tax=Manihot esculenta TaxID=3983 RepID=A0ACB7HRM6_MANES|nr:hypothetical protein MANES_05G128900v8 [Manihot esculenta]